MPRAYRPEAMTNYSPVFRGVPSLPLEVTADGGELVCIKTNAEMIPYLVTAWELFRYDYFLRGEQDEINHTHGELMTLLSQIMTAEACEDCPDCPECPDCPDCPPIGGGGGGGGGGVQLPDCIEIVQNGNEFVINIREDQNCMVTINVYEQGCGCGGVCGCGGSSGGGGSFGGGQSSGGGASGSWLVEPDQTGVVAVPEGITQCDFATTTMPLVLDSIKEFLQVIDDNAESLESAVDAIIQYTGTFQNATLFLGDLGAGTSEVVAGVLAAGSQALLSMLIDNDFRLQAQTAWIRAHGADGYITSVTRQDFFDITRYLPNTFIQSNAIVLPKVMFPIFWRIININKVNSRLIIAKDTGQTGLCEYLYAEANMTYTAPTAGTVDSPLFPSEEILLGTYAWAHTWDLRVEKFVDDAAFTYDDTEGSYWEWIEGIGYRGVPQAASPSFNRIKMFFIRNGAAPDPAICWVEYAFVHDPNSAYIDQIIGNTNFGAVDFNGVREVVEPGVDGNNFHLWLEADDANVGETGGGVSGSVVLARFAVAGNGLDFFANVTTEIP